MKRVGRNVNLLSFILYFIVVHIIFRHMSSKNKFENTVNALQMEQESSLLYFFISFLNKIFLGKDFFSSLHQFMFSFI